MAKKYATCTSCSRNKKCVAMSLQGKRLCIDCAHPEPFFCPECKREGVIKSSTQCQLCYLESWTRRRLLDWAPRDISTWAVLLIDRFARYQRDNLKGTCLPVRMIQTVKQEIIWKTLLTSESLIQADQDIAAIFTIQQLRKHQFLRVFLAKQGFSSVKVYRSLEESLQRKIYSLTEHWGWGLLLNYLTHLNNRNIHTRTKRIYLTSAMKVLNGYTGQGPNETVFWNWLKDYNLKCHSFKSQRIPA